MWGNHCRSRDFFLWIVIIVSLSISHLFTRYFFGFVFLSQGKGGTRAIKKARVTPPGGQIWPSTVSLDAQSCPLPRGVARVDKY